MSVLQRAMAIGICSLTLVAGPQTLAAASTITDGSLVVNIESLGRFNVVTLNGVDIDLTPSLQEYVLDNLNSTGFATGSAVVTAGATATYTATKDGFNIAVSSAILGPLPSNPATTDVLEQILTFTNTTNRARALVVVSDIDQDLLNTGPNDTVFWDAALQAVVATEAPQLMAAIVQTGVSGAVLGWDVDFLPFESRSFPMNNGVGPVGPGDTAMSIGFDMGTVGAGQSASVTYRYLFSIGGIASAPNDFSFNPPPTPTPTPTPTPPPGPGPVPEPTTLLLVGTGLAGAIARRRAAGHAK